MSDNHAPLYLCLDQGGHSSRALLFDPRGELRHEIRRPLTARGEGVRVEYDAGALLGSLRDCLGELSGWLQKHPHTVTAAGLATQRSNIACWDRHDGSALAPVLSWQDRRHAAWLERFNAQAERIHALTGLPLSAHYGASKLRWCLDHLPAVQQAQREQRLELGPMAAWLVARLTREGQALADPVNASRTQLWSLARHDWDDELLELFGIPRALLPPCVPNRTDFGHLALASGDIPLRLVSGDQSAALFAYGPLRRDTAYINLGTGAFISRPSGQSPVFDPQLLTSQVLGDDDHGEYVLEGTVNGAGAALDWLARQQDRAPFTPDELAGWLADVRSGIPLFLNGVGGLAAPYWRANFAPRLVGSGDPAQQAVAVLESMAFLLQVNLARMAPRLGPAQRLQVTGGLAHLDGVCQRLADLSQTPVYRPAECEATARGTAWLLAGQPAGWPEPGPGRLFEPHKHPTLQQRYTNWQEAMEKALGRG